MRNTNMLVTKYDRDTAEMMYKALTCEFDESHAMMQRGEALIKKMNQSGEDHITTETFITHNDADLMESILQILIVTYKHNPDNYVMNNAKSVIEKMRAMASKKRAL